MYRVIKIKDSPLFLRFVFGDGDVNLTAKNPMFYTEDKYIKQDIKKLKKLGIEAEVKMFYLEDETAETANNK